MRGWPFLLFSAAAVLGCETRINRMLTLPGQVRALDSRSPFLKAHMKNGDVIILHDWKVSERQAVVTGTGELEGPERVASSDRPFVVPIADVALFETNTTSVSPAIIALTVVSGVSIGVTVFCALNSKSCFGSCPTFYAPAEGGPRLMAEGFSDAIAPALAMTDVDALFRARPEGRDFDLRMTNEALETHVVEGVALLAAPRPPGGRVLADDTGALWGATLGEPSACRANEGDCLAAVARFDGVERLSDSDAVDLGARETIDLEFPARAHAGRLGLAVGMRQTLLSTYLLYQGLAWLGKGAVAWMTRATDRHALRRILGAIEVQVPGPAGAWHTVGEAYETGPIAADVHLVHLPDGLGDDGAPVRVRLRLTRGHWRLDWVALAELTGQVEPVRLEPSLRDGIVAHDFGPADRLPADRFPVVTLPGDSYTLRFRLPDGDPAAWELFLESRGYYLEWIRREWLAEESVARATVLGLTPQTALRWLAPAYKKVEKDMEAGFWRSRYAR